MIVKKKSKKKYLIMLIILLILVFFIDNTKYNPNKILSKKDEISKEVNTPQNEVIKVEKINNQKINYDGDILDLNTHKEIDSNIEEDNKNIIDDDNNNNPIIDDDKGDTKIIDDEDDNNESKPIDTSEKDIIKLAPKESIEFINEEEKYITDEGKVIQDGNVIGQIDVINDENGNSIIDLDNEIKPVIPINKTNEEVPVEDVLNDKEFIPTDTDNTNITNPENEKSNLEDALNDYFDSLF